ncbi:uncharacterized protein LOC128555902 [Mercenaria mercenaria]|uniref:uncharacterized protein LOC128555902 n=1 Tax=Mercenaria mercenaria TaxID=6596 RepID=UPI00234FA8E6|nr:uncharacterized protein LOC128555902 [Mercenaria mercenaria]
MVQHRLQQVEQLHLQQVVQHHLQQVEQLHLQQVEQLHLQQVVQQHLHTRKTHQQMHKTQETLTNRQQMNVKATSNNIPIIAGGAAAGVVACAVVGTVIAVKVCAKSAVSSVPQAATYQPPPSVPNAASYDSPPGNNSGNQGNTRNNGLRGGQDGPAKTKPQIKLPKPTKPPPTHLPSVPNAPAPPAANNGLFMDYQMPQLPSINGQFPPANMSGVPGACSYTAGTVPSAATY